MTIELLLPSPVPPQEEEQEDDGDDDEGEREVDGEDERPRRDALGPLVGLAEHGAQVARSLEFTRKKIG